jgi:3-isopropylmalate/(R)-2-methylmalate dehydratase small subunit
MLNSDEGLFPQTAKGRRKEMVVIKGKVWKFGDNINTDLIVPGGGPGITIPWEEMKKRILHTHPRFSKEVVPGDVIVGGKNWGCGSGRPAAKTLQRLGIGCVVAESYSRIYFRNSIAIGYPSVACAGVSELFDEGDMLELELETAKIRNITKGKELKGDPFSKDMLDIMAKGGILETL